VRFRLEPTQRLARQELAGVGDARVDAEERSNGGAGRARKGRNKEGKELVRACGWVN